jgi:hypothetical protein
MRLFPYQLPLRFRPFCYLCMYAFRSRSEYVVALIKAKRRYDININCYIHGLRAGNSIADIGYDVLTAVVMKSYIFWDITPRSPLKVNQYFHTICFARFLLGLFFNPECGGNMFLRNDG